MVSEFIAKGVKVNWKNPDAVRERARFAAPPSAPGGRALSARAPHDPRARAAASRLAQAGSTALYMAAQGGHLEVAQVLIDAGSELNLIARNNVRAAAAM